MKDFATRLKEIMVEHGLNQIELAKRAGLHKSAISAYLAGAYTPKQTNIYKLATALNVLPSDLLGVEDFLKENSQVDNPLISTLAKNKDKKILDVFHKLSTEAQEALLGCLQRKDLDINKLFEKREISDLELEYVEMYRALPAAQKENVKMIIKTFYDAMESQYQEKEEA